MSKTQQDRIIALGRLQWTLRKIEEATGSRRETVGKYLRAAGVVVRPPGRWGHAGAKAAIEASPLSEETPKAAIEVCLARNASQRSLCEDHRFEIAASVDKGVCAKVIWEELDGFTGSYASVKRFVRQLKAAARSGSSPSVGTIRTGPGKEA